ncbi:efflux RND transporter periplasmic adaptor subunit [Fodinicurvata sp. EGI_FJ10296]|uniref:efflux RND transporter periplasmic adaptor subunit n=1 Tax=Fodinicurvata sp. EGI_FJ10296 TaxID=3231908 RepID=UPI0034519CE2
MKKLILIAAIAGIGVGAWLGYDTIFATGENDDPPQGVSESGTGSTPAENRPEQRNLQQVRVRTIAAEPMQEEIILQGRTMAQRTVTITAQVSGTVVAVEADRGETVDGDQIIIRLSSDDREARAEEARALVRQRQAEFDAAQTLNQRGVRSSTDVTQAEAALQGARAAVSAAELALDRMIVRAPFGGILDSRRAELGAFIDAGEEVAVIIDLDPLRIRGQVSERNLGDIRTGDTGQVRLVGGDQVEGQVTYIGATADERTRTFPVELEVPNPDNEIIENLTAEIRLPLAETSAHRIEASLLSLSDDGVIGVKSVDNDGTVVFNPIEILGDSDGAVWVSGLPETATIITVGQEFVVADERVIPVDEADIAARTTQ